MKNNVLAMEMHKIALNARERSAVLAREARASRGDYATDLGHAASWLTALAERIELEAASE